MVQVVVAQSMSLEVVVELLAKTVRVPEDAAGMVRVMVEALIMVKSTVVPELPEVGVMEPPDAV